MPQTDPAQTTADPLDQLNLVNAGYVADLYEQYRQDPASVDPEWRSIFDQGHRRLRAGPGAACRQQRRPAGRADGASPPPTRHNRRRRAIGPGGSDPDQGAGRAAGAEHDGQPGGPDRDELP